MLNMFTFIFVFAVIQHQGLPVRPNTTEIYLRKNQLLFGEKNQLVQETTRVIVELIKVLIECANKVDLEGIQLASDQIYDKAYQMATKLLLKVSSSSCFYK